MPELLVCVILMKDRANVLLVKPRSGDDAESWSIPDCTIHTGVSVRETAINLGKNYFGLEINPQMTLFICERIVAVKPPAVPHWDHRIGIFVLAEPTAQPGKEPEIYSGDMLFQRSPYSEAKWVDVRSLGELQKKEGMSEFTADAFVKFSAFLRSQVPASGTVN